MDEMESKKAFDSMQYETERLLALIKHRKEPDSISSDK